MRALDAAMYPHIVDTIFAHADGRALLRLRTASKAWCGRANALLSTHLVLFSSGLVGAVVQDAMVPHPGFHPFSDTTFKWEGAAAVVDIVGMAENYTVPRDFFESPPTVMRIWENEEEVQPADEPYAAAETVVVFAWPRAGTRCGKCDGCKLAEDSNGRSASPSATLPNGNDLHDAVHYTPFGYLGSGTRKLVVNLSLASGVMSDSEYKMTTFEPDYIDYCGTLEEIVLVLSLGEGATAVGDARLPRRFLDALFAIVEGPRIKYTIVNAAGFPSAMLPLVPLDDFEEDRPQTWEAFHSRTSLQECAEVFFREHIELLGGGDDEIPEVDWLSCEEYEASVGTEAFVWETMERPWAAGAHAAGAHAASQA
jgi:hypothetical protein